MATATKKPAPAKKSASTAVVPWEQEMAAAASKAAKAEKVTGISKKISTQGGVLSIDDSPVEDNELRAIVIGYVFENQYYDKPYDPRNPSVPACYAFSEPDADEPEDSLKPHEEAEDKQGDDNGLCANCWANKMGTADVGRGKACKNIRRLAIITEDALESPEALADAEVRMLNVPVMSCKNWAKFVNTTAEDMNRPYWGTICLIKIVPDPKSQFLITFKFEELINFDAELYAAMKKKHEEINQQLIAPYPKQADLDAANAAAKPAARKAPGKPGAKPAAAAKGGKKY